MALVGDVVLCLQLVQNIYDGSKMLHETWANCHRLGERTLIFTEILEKYKNNPHLLTPLIQSHIAGFKQTLVDIEEFIRKYRKQTVTKAVTKVLFRNTLAREVELLNSRLNDYAISLGVIQSIDYESKRAEDVEDTRRTFERSVSQVIDQISNHGGDTLSALEELEHDIARNTETMQEILGILSHLPVSQDDLLVIERDTKCLRELAYHRHEELVATLLSVESKVDDVRRLLHDHDQRDVALQQTKAYVDHVRALLISATDLHVALSSTASGEQTAGGFVVHEGRMGSSTAVTLKTLPPPSPSSPAAAAVARQAAGAPSLLEQCQRLEYEALVLRSFAQSPQIVRVFGVVYGHSSVTRSLPRELLCEYPTACQLSVSTSPALVVERAPLGSLADRVLPRVPRVSSASSASSSSSSAACVVTTHDAVSWLLHLAEALAFLAQRQCLHTAVEPGHVLLYPQGVAKLTGFGRSLRLDTATQTLHPLVPLWADAVPPPAASPSPLSASLSVPSFLRPCDPSVAASAAVPDLYQLYYRAPEWTAYLDAALSSASSASSPVSVPPLSHTVDVYSLGRIGLQLLRLPLTAQDAASSGQSAVLVAVRAEVTALCDEACHEESHRRPSPSEVHRRLRSLWERLPPPQPLPSLSLPQALPVVPPAAAATVPPPAAAATTDAASTVSSLTSASASSVGSTFTAATAATTGGGSSGGGSLRSLRGAMAMGRPQLRYLNAQGEREYLVSASEDKTLRLWRVRWPSRHHPHHHRWTPPAVGSVRSFVGHSHGVFSVAGLPEAMLASGSWDRSVRLWDALTGDCLRVLHGHDKTALCLAWSASVSRLVSGGADKTLRVWDLAADDAGPVATLTGHSDAVTAVRFLVDDATATATEPQRQRLGHVVSSSLDKTLRLWDVAAGTCLRELRGHRQVVLCVAPLRQGAYVVSGDLRGDYCVWNTTTGAQETQLSPPSESPSSSYADAVVCVDDGGGHLVTSGDDHRLRLWLPVA
eukprot:gene10786-7675_t